MAAVVTVHSDLLEVSGLHSIFLQRDNAIGVALFAALLWAFPP
jgi:hypothetical protein